MLSGLDIKNYSEILSFYDSKNDGTTERTRKCEKGQSVC